ncbi:MAG: MFS transporter [Actinomycetota bacterium]|nr:MFS transporter [Actinomycetota bacterium]
MGQRWFGSQFALLGRPGPFRLISLAALGSGIGTWLAAVALQVDIFDRTHSGVWIAALVIVEFLPTIVVGLVLGPFVDRLSRRRLMIASDLARFGVFVALPFVDSTLGIVVLAGVAGVATSVFRPALYAGVPNLVEEDELTSANSLLQAIDHGTTALAPPIAGLLVAAQGPHLAYWVNAASFLLSAALLVRVPASKLQTAVSATRGLLRDVGDGMRTVLGSPALMTVLLVWTTAILANGAINVSEIAFAKDSLDSGAFGFGLLAGAAGLGLALGSLLAAPWIDRRGVSRAYASSFVLMAAGFAVAAVAPNVWVAALCVVISGIGNGAAVVCNFTFIGRGASDAFRGRVITLLMSATAVTFVIGTLVGGQLTDTVGPRWVWGGSAATYALVALLAVAMAARTRSAPTAVDPLRP